MSLELRYRLAPGVEIVPQGDGSFQLRSDFAALRLSGETAVAVAERILPALREPKSMSALALLLQEYRPESLQAQLEVLVDEGILIRGAAPHAARNAPFHALLDGMGLDVSEAVATLAAKRVGVFGLEAHGAHAAAILSEVGVGALTLVDPFPFDAAHFSITPVRDAAATSGTREQAIAALVTRPELTITMGGAQELNRERVRDLAAGCDLLLACWDRGFGAATHWINEAALAHRIPALYSQLNATSTSAGPFCLPERSACWMCYRMRVLAAEPDFEMAMAFEEHLDKAKAPVLAKRPLLPTLPAHLGAVVALEALKYLLRINEPTLVDKVQTFNGFSGESTVHPVLVAPSCPACSKKKARESPTASELIASTCDGPRLPAQAPSLVSALSGVVLHLSAVAKDATEPHVPHVWRARLSNHCFLPEANESHMVCSGKGFYKDAALASCLGEAVERYAGGCWDLDELVLARRADLDGPSLDPRDLVLYRPEQYAALPYAAYSDESTMRWIRARSLVTGDVVWVPALAVFMEYQVHAPEEFLAPITSNGLAAGATLAEAVLGAIYEVIERDGVLVNWMNQFPARCGDARTHPEREVRHLADAYRRRGVDLALYRLPTDHPVTVFMAVAFQRDGFGGPFATVGMGADLDATVAARRAALEVGQVRPAFRERCRTAEGPRIRELVEDPRRVTKMEDHALLYADPCMASAFAFLGDAKYEWPAPRPLDASDALRQLLQHFGDRGQDVLYVNLTPRDLAPLGLHAARVILPGFQPIWFGDGERRMGGRRVFDAPVLFGLSDVPATFESLNALPHPVA